MSAPSWVQAVGKRVLGREPQQLVDWEPFVVRALFALITARHAPILSGLSFHDAPFPNGLANYLELWELSSLSSVLFGLFLVALICYAAGVVLPLATGYLALITVVAGTLKNSQGAIGHSHQILALLMCGQFAVYTWAHFKHSGDQLAKGHALSNIVSPQLVAYVYVTTAISKLRISGLDWFRDSPNIVVEIIKTHSQGYYNQLEQGMLERGQRIAEALVEHQTFTRVLIGSGLVLEILGFVGLFGKRWGLLMAVLLTSFHSGVKILMSLNFEANQMCLLLFMGHIVFWGLWAVQKYVLGRPVPAPN